MRLISRVLSLFIERALHAITQIRQKLTIGETGDYNTNSQDRNYKSWSIATHLEVAAVNTLVRVFYCSELLQEPVNEYLIQWKYLIKRPMFQIWKHTDIDMRNLVSRTIVLNTQAFKMNHSRSPLEVTRTNEWLAEVTQLRSQVTQLIGLKEASTASDPSKEISQRLIEATINQGGGGELVLTRAHTVVHRIRFEEGKPNVVDLRMAVKDLEALLSEGIKNNNGVLTRMLIHAHLASVQDALGNKAIAVQHRAIREDLKNMLEPEQVAQMQDPYMKSSAFVRESRRAKGDPVNLAQSLAIQLETRQAEITKAESDEPVDALHVLSCVDRFADTLRDLGREAEAAEQYLRVIRGREQLLPANNKAILIVRFARTKLLLNLRRYDESIEELRLLQENYKEIGDAKLLSSISGTLGNTLHRSVK